VQWGLAVLKDRGRTLQQMDEKARAVL